VVWTGSIWLRIGASEHGNELLGSIKCWEVSEQVHEWRLFKKGSVPRVSVSSITIISNCYDGCISETLLIKLPFPCNEQQWIPTNCETVKTTSYLC
jgi:hypothetical protein